jgi:stearoyl-CoA desaturase (delta-9 desaturase)
MAPNTKESSTIQNEEEWEVEQPEEEFTKERPPTEVVWRNVYAFVVLHVAALVGLYMAFTSAQYKTLFFAYILHFLSGLGVTAGAHRLWAHRSYKAKTPLRIFLMLCNCIAFQNDLIEWARDHRVHHKFSETEADPHNARRGFFFAHMGWLMVKKHPDVGTKGKNVDFTDLYQDPLLQFQRRHYLKLIFLICFFLPTAVPIYCWGEEFWTAFFVCAFMRYCWTLNCTWLVNSAAHLWGQTPYDKTINPRENIFVSFGAGGEGWHNYHHTFPMDYKAAEVPYFFNTTTAMIDLWAKMGQAYDLRVAPKTVIDKRKIRTGDPTLHYH